MHVEICTSSRIDLWDLLEAAEGTKQHRELVECLPAKNLRNHQQYRATVNGHSSQDGRNDSSESLSITSLTIANIRKGHNLASSKLPFLWKLHELLEDVEKTGDDHIISWMPSGGFRVHKPKSFVQKIIPYYFKQSKYKSFQRQLHLYEFVRTQRGVEAGAYCHPKFVRGNKSLCLSLSPHKIKGRKPRSEPTTSQGTYPLNETVYPSLGKRFRVDSNASTYPSLGKRLRTGNQDHLRGSNTQRNSTFSLNSLQ
jgi:hypothetical protein